MLMEKITFLYMKHRSYHIQTNGQGIGSHGIVLAFSEKNRARIKILL